MTILPVGKQNSPLRFFRDQIICPYCGSEQNYRSRGCCGESSNHFETVCVEIGTNEQYTNDQVNEIYAGFDALEVK